MNALNAARWQEIFCAALKCDQDALHNLQGFRDEAHQALLFLAYRNWLQMV